jgi:hypothetical protein
MKGVIYVGVQNKCKPHNKTFFSSIFKAFPCEFSFLIFQQNEQMTYSSILFKYMIKEHRILLFPKPKKLLKKVIRVGVGVFIFVTVHKCVFGQ